MRNHVIRANCKYQIAQLRHRSHSGAHPVAPTAVIPNAARNLSSMCARQHRETSLKTFFLESIRRLSSTKVTSGFPSAVALQFHKPPFQRPMMLFFQIQKFNSHTNPRLHDAHHRQCLNGLIFPRKFQFHPAAQLQRLAGTYKASAQRQIGRYSTTRTPCSQIDKLRVRREWVPYRVSPVTHRHRPRPFLVQMIVHGDHVLHGG